MDAATISAASGLRARMESLDMLANNLANAATSGFKQDYEAYGLYASPDASGGAFSAAQTLPVIERPWTSFSQGVLETTGNPFDLALSGGGFFAVDGPSGPLYTRNGRLSLSPTGRLITADGYAVRSTGDTPLTAEPNQSIEVSADGVVRQGGRVLGSIAVVDFANPENLTKVGHNYFRSVDPAQAVAGGAQVHQGKLETSNVSTPEAAVRLVAVMRQFEMLQRAISLTADMNRKAVEDVARVP